MKLNKYIGNKQFYYKVFVIAIPLLIQQLITSFVNMLDNIMVGQTGTLAMSGVSVSNQIVTVFNLAVFGSISAASIFGAQFAGKKDTDGVRNCLRFKLIVALFKDLVDICKNAIVILSISSVKINRHWQFNDISAYEWYLFHH